MTDEDALAVFEEAVALLARDELPLFAQFVLRNEQPETSRDFGVVSHFDADGVPLSDEAKEVLTEEEADLESSRAADLFAELASGELGDGDDLIELQPYHFDLLESYRTGRVVVVTAHTESGKTQLMIAYLLWLLGRHPEIRIAVVSEGGKLARTICRTMARYIAEESFSGCQALRKVFPNLRPGRQWNVIDGFEVQRGGAVKDPSFAAFGADTGITGYRVDVAACDDYITPKNTATPYQRKQVEVKFNTTVYNRITKHGQVLMNSNAQWTDDLTAKLEGKEGVTSVRMRVTKDGTPEGPLEWAAKWPRSRIMRVIAQNPDYRAQLFAERRKQGEFGRFTSASLELAKSLGRGYSLMEDWRDPPDGYTVCIGIDFAFTQSRKSDQSAIVVGVLEPSGRRRLLYATAGKWTEAQGLDRLRGVVSRFPRHRARAESNGAQKWIVERWSSDLGIVLEPYHTTGKKWDPVLGIPGLAAAFQLGQWVLPSDAATGEAPVMVQHLCDELLGFDPTPGVHTGDYVMALFFVEGLALDSGKLRDFRHATTNMAEFAERERERAERLARGEVDPPSPSPRPTGRPSIHRTVAIGSDLPPVVGSGDGTAEVPPAEQPKPPPPGWRKFLGGR